MASLFAGTPQTAPSYAATTTDVPKWLQDYTVDLFSQQRAVSGTPYQPYALPRIAQTTAPTTQAQNLIESNVGAYQPAVSGAISGTQNLAGQTSVGNVGAYMNPYTQNVTDQIAKLGARNLSENLLPAVSDQFTRAGQFGSSGMGVFGGRALRDTQESVLANQTNALNTGYTQALGASQADLARQQGALAASADLAKSNQGLKTADAAALESIGTAQQQQTQKGLDVAYQDYQNQILYPQTQINNMSTTLRGLPPAAVPTTGTTSGYSTTFSPSPLSTIAGAYGTIQGLSKGFAHGGSVGNAGNDSLEQSVMNDYGHYFNHGGRVPGYANEGLVDTTNPAPDVQTYPLQPEAPNYSQQPAQQIEPTGGGYDVNSIAAINPKFAEMMRQYGVGSTNYTNDIRDTRQALADERAAYNKSLDTLAHANIATGPSESEKWFSRAAAFLDPGKTGSFGEGVQHFAVQEAANRAEQRKADSLNAATAAQYGLKKHELTLESLRDEAKTLQALQSDQSKERRAMIAEYIKGEIANNKVPDKRILWQLYVEDEKAAGRVPLSFHDYESEQWRATNTLNKKIEDRKATAEDLKNRDPWAPTKMPSTVSMADVRETAQSSGKSIDDTIADFKAQGVTVK